MPRRTQVFQQLPWTGGINTSVDSGVIPPNDLVKAENIVFTTSGVRRKREGRTYFDALSDIPAVTHRSSSGTTRTLKFAAAVTDATVDKLFVGEGINVTTTTTSGNEYTYYQVTAGTVAAITTTTITDDSITYTAVGSLTETSTATTTCTVARAYPIVKLVDYWRWTGSALAQRIVGITSQPKIVRYDSSGNRKEITKDSGATARVGTSTKVCSVVFNERLIVAQTRTGNVPSKYYPESDTDWVDLGGTPPDFSICAVHLNRVWTNDKANKDRLHYSATANAEKWNGADDSGALDIRPGDGDPTGISSIFAFKGRIFVSKQNKIYQVVGDSPENFQILDVSQGIGCIAQDAVAALDQDDVYYVSKRGVHSIGATASFGDFEGQYLSTKIQPSFNDWLPSRLEFTKTLYIPFLNSVAFAVSEVDTSAPDIVWLYNIINKEWYQWPDLAATAMTNALFTSVNTLLIATNSGKIVKAQNGTFVDYTNEAIPYYIKSGTIYPDNNVLTLKNFKRVTIFFKPRAGYSLSVIAKIDTHSAQTLTFTGSSSGDLLGVSFHLGVSTLGADTFFAPYTLPIDGIGHGITLEVRQSGLAEEGDIYGYAIEWEPAEFPQETGDE